MALFKICSGMDDDSNAGWVPHEADSVGRSFCASLTELSLAFNTILVLWSNCLSRAKGAAARREKNKFLIASQTNRSAARTWQCCVLGGSRATTETPSVYCEACQMVFIV